MTILTSLVFAVALFLSARTVMGFCSNLRSGQPFGTFQFAVVASLAWGLFYYLTR